MINNVVARRRRVSQLTAALACWPAEAAGWALVGCAESQACFWAPRTLPRRCSWLPLVVIGRRVVARLQPASKGLVASLPAPTIGASTTPNMLQECRVSRLPSRRRQEIVSRMIDWLKSRPRLIVAGPIASEPSAGTRLSGQHASLWRPKQGCWCRERRRSTKSTRESGAAGAAEEERFLRIGSTNARPRDRWDEKPLLTSSKK
jgi:hypothetical protein